VTSVSLGQFREFSTGAQVDKLFPSVAAVDNRVRPDIVDHNQARVDTVDHNQVRNLVRVDKLILVERKMVRVG